SCNHAWTADDMHSKILHMFARYEMSAETQEQILDALDIVWSKDNEQKAQNIAQAKRSILELKLIIKQQVESVADPSNASIKDDLLAIVEEKKAKLTNVETELERLNSEDETDKREFMAFALNFIQDTGKHFLEPYVTKEHRIKCKQMLF